MAHPQDSTIVEAEAIVKTLDLKHLQQLQSLITVEVENRKKSQVSDAFLQIRAIASGVGLSVEQLTKQYSKLAKLSQPAKNPLPVLYRDPKNDKNTWSGRGHRPRWLAEALAGGAKLEKYAVKPKG